jgi:hypothetical protein
MFPKEVRLKLPQGATMLLREEKLFLPKDVIIFQGKKGLSCPPRRLKLLLP